jgi:hypothetical protein
MKAADFRTDSNRGCSRTVGVISPRGRLWGTPSPGPQRRCQPQPDQVPSAARPSHGDGEHRPGYVIARRARKPAGNQSAFKQAQDEQSIRQGQGSALDPLGPRPQTPFTKPRRNGRKHRLKPGTLQIDTTQRRGGKVRHRPAQAVLDAGSDGRVMRHTGNPCSATHTRHTCLQVRSGHRHKPVRDEHKTMPRQAAQLARQRKDKPR